MLSAPLIAYGVLGVVVLALLVWLLTLELRLKKLFRGKSVGDLEAILRDMGAELDDIRAFRAELDLYLREVEARLKKGVRRVETLRFNPFENAGSNQSFATALLDEEGDGVVISTLYSREKVGVYAKPVKSYVSEYPLSEEESHVIARVKK